MTNILSRSRPRQIEALPLRTLWVDTLTVFWGEWLDLRVRIPQVAASGLVSPLIYIVAFGMGLGSAIDQVSTPSGNGYDSVAPSFAPPTLTTKDKIQQYGHHHQNQKRHRDRQYRQNG